MAKRPRRFKKVSVSFPIDLYLKVAAIVEGAAPHSMSSWVVEACRAKLPLQREISGRALMNELFPGPTVLEAHIYEERIKQDIGFHREAYALASPRLTDNEALAVTDAIADKAAAQVEPLPLKSASWPEYMAVDPDAAAQELARREFGPQVLSAAARSVPGWGKWDWKQRLEHLRELKAAAVSG